MLVRMVISLETRAGTKFPKGMVVKVDSATRTKLSLSAPNPDKENIFGPRRIQIRDVSLWNVEKI